MAEAGGRKLTEDLKTAEAMIVEKDETLTSLERQLSNTQNDLEQTNKRLEEKEAKVRDGLC